MIKFRDIPQIAVAKYHVDISWNHIMEWLEDVKVNMDPDFQREYIWTQTQRKQYIEWILRGGNSGKDIYFNHPNWFKGFKGEMVIVDGKQRVNAVLDFIGNKIKAYDFYYNQYENKITPLNCSFSVYVADLEHKKDVLQWYIDMNTGGTCHTNEEIEHVKNLLKEENAGP